MLSFRKGENQPYPYRSGRYFNANGCWYFASREAPVQGPYLQRTEAEAACARFLQRRRASHQKA